MKDFFERQDEARRSTVWLVALYALAVGGLIVALYAVLVVVTGTAHWWEPALLGAVAAGTGLVVGGGSAFKFMQLRDGGGVVAEQLGGRPLGRSEVSNAEEQCLLNVVEEMAIAAGVPVPSVYVLPEEGINAFAAGHTLDDAVVGVTEGCMQRLERAELQGVVAHEFSHILNGDMRINLRLIGLLHGILLISLIGRLLMYGGGSGRSRGNRTGVLIGLAFFAVGSVGVVVGRIIQSAISRQREFLADAAAVQFTRNPDGLAGALKKIAGLERGGEVRRAEMQETSHLFFSYPLSGRFLASLFSTHPPLEERVRRLGSNLEEDFTEEVDFTEERSASPQGVSSLQGATTSSRRVQAEKDHVAETAGTIDPEHVQYGHDMLDALPPSLREAAHDPLGAVALVYGLLLDPAPVTRESQLSVLRPRLEHGVHEELQRLFPILRNLERPARLLLVDIAAPALRELSQQQYVQFSTNIQRLVEADNQLTIFEYALRTIVLRRLRRVFRSDPPGRPRYRTLRQVHGPVEALLSALAHVGHRSDEAVRSAFRAGWACFPEVNETDASFREPAPVTPQTLDRALRQLERARPPLQRQVVDACAHCVLHDREVTAEEAELLRAVAIALGAPLPPFLPQAYGTEEAEEQAG